MKARITTMVAMMVITLTVAAMPYTEARNKAMFLSDKMAYELNLSKTQFNAVYEINLDYMLNLDEESDVFGYNWEIRNRDLAQVLSDWQNNQYLDSEWFCRPFTCNANGWTLAVNDRYEKGQFLMDKPEVFYSYKGGHNHMDASFYADQDFDSPNPPVYLGQAN